MKRVFFVGIGYVLLYCIWSRIVFAYVDDELWGSFYYLPMGSPNMLEYSVQLFFTPLNELDQMITGAPFPAGLLDYGLSG